MKRQDETMTTKPTLHYGPTIGDMRLSRLSHPRATLFAVILLAGVFLLFGLLTSTAEVSHTPAPNTVDGAVSLIGHWLVAQAGISL